MEERGLRPQFLSAGVPEDKIDIALSDFYSRGGAPEITSMADYTAAHALYGAMDASVPPDDLHSPVARYVISLGARMAEWEAKAHTVVSADS